MKIAMYLITPTVMVGLGLYLFKSVPVTFVLFYGWLVLAVLINKAEVRKGWNPSQLTLVVGGVSGLLMYGVIFGGIALFQDFLINEGDLLILLDHWDFTGIWLVFILLFINPVLEELYWRGILYQKLLKNHTQVVVILLTSGFYTLYHILSMLILFNWPINLFLIIPVFLVGVFWGYMRTKAESFTGTIISHFLADAGVMSVYWFLL